MLIRFTYDELKNEDDWKRFNGDVKAYTKFLKSWGYKVKYAPLDEEFGQIIDLENEVPDSVLNEMEHMFSDNGKLKIHVTHETLEDKMDAYSGIKR